MKGSIRTVAFMIVAALPTHDAIAGLKHIRPMSAEIVSPRGEIASQDQFGDVRVTLSNGRREIWTRKGGCALVNVSKTGLVGWTHGKSFHRTQGLMNSSFVIARQNKVVARIEAERPFIQSWDFADHDACVIILSAAAHGPGEIQKFRISTGELLAGCFESEPFEKKPRWAQAFVVEEYRRHTRQGAE
jgi:hypothetical protein